MRKALVVGINYYEHGPALFGCVNDGLAVKEVLERHADNSKNFGVKTAWGRSKSERVTRSGLKRQIRELFDSDGEIALFYFAGHGHIEATGGYLLASDSNEGDEGVSLGDVLTYANNSRARNRIILLDSCHSGIAGSSPSSPASAEIKEGTTILTASTAEQYASEKNGAGVFTGLLVDALKGAACNLVGEITPGGVYAHVDQSLGEWNQRPVFKTNVTSFVSLRKVKPPIPLETLHKITSLFPIAGHVFPLDPTFEPERSPGDSALPAPKAENTRKFAILQKYNRVGLVVPVGAPHMWHAAMRSKSCRLTAFGEHYRRLVEDKRI